jgi:hypothetical protein
LIRAKSICDESQYQEGEWMTYNEGAINQNKEDKKEDYARHRLINERSNESE